MGNVGSLTDFESDVSEALEVKVVGNDRISVIWVSIIAKS